MPVHLNLLHEIEKAERERRRDPLKLGMLALAVVALLFVGYYFVRLGQVHGVHSEQAVLAAQWRELEPKKIEAEKIEQDLTETMKASEILVQRIENRFYWAPFLQVLIETVPRNVQIVRMSADVSAEGLKRCGVTLDGIAAGAEPRAIAESLRTTLSGKLSELYGPTTDSFKSLDDGTETALLDGVNLPTAIFTLSYGFAADKPTTPATATVPTSATAPKPTAQAKIDRNEI